MKRFYFTCIFLFAYFLSNSQGHSVVADSFFVVGHYQQAAIEFERLAFEEGDEHERSVFLLKKSYCYKALTDYEQALKIIDRINVKKNDSISQLVTYERILLNYLSENYINSYNEILKYKLRNKSISKELIFLESLNLIAMNNWKDAKNVIVQNQQFLEITEDKIAYIFSQKLKPKNPDKAFNLSMFLPGVGQIYSGYVFKGLVSGGIQSVLIGFSALSLYKGYFFTGGMTGVALFYTFYFGGARHARELANRKNLEISTDLSNRLLIGTDFK